MGKPGDVLGQAAFDRLATSFASDFRFGPLNVVLVLILCLGGMAAHLALGSFELRAVLTMVVIAVALASSLYVLRFWEAVLVLTTAAGLAVYLRHRPDSTLLVAAAVLAGILSPCVQVANQWERAVLLRFGKFLGLRGSGVFLLWPVIDKVSSYVDQRIRVTDFKAETTLTRDTVPVNVDAIAFWMVWDAEKSVLEVQNFEAAVSLSAQTALRDGIGRHELSDMLSNREKLGKEIQQVLDAKTNSWGITVQSVEIRDIIIPKALEDAMSRQAQAERERQSRIILSTAETEIAENFARAAASYRDNPAALHLRGMNMVFEGLKQKGSMVIVPSTAVETMGLGAIGGLTAFDRAGRSAPGADAVAERPGTDAEQAPTP